jgi:hypothetical protein
VWMYYLMGRVGRLLLYASLEIKIYIAENSVHCVYVFICELEIGCNCSVAVALHVIPARRDVFSMEAKCGSYCLLSETWVFNEPVMQCKKRTKTLSTYPRLSD